ncbi:MAG: DUF5317 domain-containing protein [Bacillales bacterium]|nr:DUF5317 domain-containing protein [Bacillales bacterium]
MVLLLLFLAFLYGKIRGGNLDNAIQELSRLKNIWLFIIASIIEHYVLKGPSVLSKDFLLKYQPYIYSFYAVMILLSYWYNKNNKYIAIIGAGFLLNTLVIIANGFKMPVAESALLAAGLDHRLPDIKAGLDPMYQLSTDQTQLKFLSDIFYIPNLLIFQGVFSIGDVIQAIGAFFFFSSAMVKR